MHLNYSIRQERTPGSSMASGLSNDGGDVSLRASEAALVSLADIAQTLQVDWSEGLSAAEAERRRQVYGLNEFNIKEDEPLWRKYLNQVTG